MKPRKMLLEHPYFTGTEVIVDAQYYYFSYDEKSLFIVENGLSIGYCHDSSDGMPVWFRQLIAEVAKKGIQEKVLHLSLGMVSKHELDWLYKRYRLADDLLSETPKKEAELIKNFNEAYGTSYHINYWSESNG